MFDAKLFALINGLAGHHPKIDLCGRYAAVYGLLVILLLAVAVVWWPRIAPALRRRYLATLLLTAAGCLLLSGLEWLLTTQILHHDLRTRPFEARWTTLLITTETGMSFPAWPAVIAFSLLPATLRIARRIGWLLLALSLLFGFSLIFVGINYPVDVIIGGLLGIAIGETAAQMTMLTARPRTMRIFLASFWAALLLGTGTIAFHLRTTSIDYEAKSTPRTLGSVLVSASPAVQTLLTRAASPDEVAIEAASNGHLLAAEARVVQPGASAERANVETLVRHVANAAFSGWPRLDLLTVTVCGSVQHGGVTRYNTLYTATIERKQWPPTGFALNQKLPGKKFNSTQLR